MIEIDLIPADYRRRIDQWRAIRRAAVVFGCLVVAAIVAGQLITAQVTKLEARVAQLQSRNAISQQQRDQLEVLRSEEASLERQWSLLRGLRAGAAAEDIFAIVDSALSGKDIWFLNWEFRRAGVIVGDADRGVDTGYFIVVPANDPSGTAPDWQVETHMNIQGQAKDHQALSTFVRALFEQRHIVDVSVRKSSLTDYAGGRAVSFDMTVVLASPLRES